MVIFIFGWREWISERKKKLERRDDGVVSLLALEIHCNSTQGQGYFCEELQETSTDNMALIKLQAVCVVRLLNLNLFCIMSQI